MTVSTLARVLLRRWYVTALGLVATVLLGSAAMSQVRPTYQAAGDVLLVAPQGPKGANPYLNLGSVAGVPSVLALAMTDDKAQAANQQAGLPGTYTVEPDSSGGGAVLIVTGKGSTAEIALQSLRMVMQRVAPTLLDMQRALNVPTASLITTQTIQTDTKATALHKSQTRAVIGAVAVGLILTVLLAAAAELIANRRRDRRSRSNAQRPTQRSDRRTRRTRGSARTADVTDSAAGPGQPGTARADDGTAQRAVGARGRRNARAAEPAAQPGRSERQRMRRQLPRRSEQADPSERDTDGHDSPFVTTPDASDRGHG